MALYHVAKFSTPLPTNLISNRSAYGREVAQADVAGFNLSPVWTTTHFEFTYGVAGTQLASTMVTDLTGPVTITRISGGTQNGISWNDTLKRWEYDGVIGDPGSGSWLMRADDGINPPVDATITSSVVATQLSVNFTLTSTVGGTLLPFAFGHAFAEGDVPSGANVAATGLSTFQCTPKTYWPDGSLKFGIVAGRATLSAGIATAITLTTGTASGGANLTSSDIQAAAPTASVQCGALGTVSLTSLLGAPFRTWISGPQMVECHYRADVGGGTLLSVWFHVKLWANGTMWVRAIVENGYLDNGLGGLPGNADQAYIPTVTIGGTQVYTNGGASLTHYRNTRWMAEGWIGTDPQITPKHDVAYLRSTRLVPRYYWTAPTEAKLASYTYTYSPMSQGNIPAGMEGTGFGEHIGLLPNWDALYCTTGDVRVYRACVNNSSALNHRPIVMRAKNTNLIPSPSTFPTWSMYGPNGGGAGVEGRGGLTYEVHHSPNEGYLAYILTGDYWHFETLAMQAFWAYFGLPASRGSGVNRINLQSQPRGIGWAARTVGCYAAIAPQGDTVADSYRSWLATGHMTYWAGQGPYNVNAKQLGWPISIGTYDPSLPATQPPWQFHFWMQSQGFLKDIKPGFSSTTDQDALTDWMYKGVVGILGGNSTAEYCYTKASQYYITISPDIVPNYTWLTPDRFYSTWGEVHTATWGAPNTSCGSVLEGTSGGHPSAAATGYWGNLMPAIAYAVDHGATGAQTAFNRMVNASNWSTVAGSGFDNIPIWGVMPRNYTALPSWATDAALPAGTFSNISLNTLNDVKPAGWPASGSQAEGASPFVNWSSGVYASNYSTLGAYVVFGSGHLAVGTPLWCGVNVFDLDTRTWAIINRPVVNHLSGEPTNEYAEYPDGHIYPPHTYDGLTYLPSANGGGPRGSLIYGAVRMHTFDLNSVNGPPVRRVSSINTGQYAGYASTAYDSTRNGVWVADYEGTSSLRFISCVDWSVTTYAGGTPGNRDMQTIYIPPPYDCLVRIGLTQTSWGVAVLQLPVTGGWVRPPQSGTGPTDTRCGGQWSTLLNCIVSYQAAGSYTVHKLTPPAAGSQTTGTWTWTSETLTGNSGATPTQNTANRGAWSRFIEVPAARCFIWADSITGSVQAWRLTGM